MLNWLSAPIATAASFRSQRRQKQETFPASAQTPPSRSLPLWPSFHACHLHILCLVGMDQVSRVSVSLCLLLVTYQTLVLKGVNLTEKWIPLSGQATCFRTRAQIFFWGGRKGRPDRIDRLPAFRPYFYKSAVEVYVIDYKNWELRDCFPSAHAKKKGGRGTWGGGGSLKARASTSTAET